MDVNQRFSVVALAVFFHALCFALIDGWYCKMPGTSFAFWIGMVFFSR